MGLYGLKNAPRLWYQRLQIQLLKIGFVELESAVCIEKKFNLDTRICRSHLDFCT